MIHYKSTPKGYKHSWLYKENDKSYGNKIKIYQIKRRTRRARSEGSFKRGSKVIWKWNGIENIKRIGKGLYKHTIRFYKKPEATKIKGQRKWVTYKKRK